MAGSYLEQGPQSPPDARFRFRTSNRRETTARRVTIQNWGSDSNMDPHSHPRSRINMRMAAAMPQARRLIHVNCRIAHFHAPDSLRVTASVGRHCIASTKKTNNPAADEGVKRGEPSSRLEFLILTIKGSASASSPVPNRTLVEDTKTSLAAKLAMIEIDNCQSAPMGANTGSTLFPIRPR